MLDGMTRGLALAYILNSIIQWVPGANVNPLLSVRLALCVLVSAVSIAVILV